MNTYREDLRTIELRLNATYDPNQSGSVFVGWLPSCQPLHFHYSDWRNGVDERAYVPGALRQPLSNLSAEDRDAGLLLLRAAYKARVRMFEERGEQLRAGAE